MNEISYLAETAAHDHEIEDINAEAFGPGRFARAAYKIREGGPHERDLSFVAFDDSDWMTFSSPRITTVAQPTLSIGRTAATLMLDRLTGDLLGPVVVRELPTRFVRRESTGPVRKRP